MIEQVRRNRYVLNSMVLSIGNIAAAVAVVEEEEEVAKLLTEVSLSRATNCQP